MLNVLIVESENDQYFVEALITHLNYQEINVVDPICAVDDYKCLGGLSLKRLKEALFYLKDEVQTANGIQKIGIILDRDNETEANRLELVNTAIQAIFETDQSFSSTSELITIDIDSDSQVKMACYFTHVEGKGELETVLKAIKNQDSTYADCLFHWKDCLEEQGKPIKEKEFDKLWVNFYQRFDCCDKKDRYQAARKCNPEASMKKGIYNLDSPVLDDFKQFLSLFR